MKNISELKYEIYDSKQYNKGTLGLFYATSKK
jgi:hypothetical protein